MTEPVVLVVELDVTGCRIHGPSTESSSCENLTDVIGHAEHATHIALVPGPVDATQIATVSAVAAGMAEHSALGVFADNRGGYALSLSRRVGDTLGPTDGFVTVAAAGFVVTRDIIEHSEFRSALTSSSALALFALLFDRVGSAEVLASTGITVAQHDAMADSPELYIREWYTEFNAPWAEAFAGVAATSAVPSVSLQSAYLYLLQWRIMYGSNFSYKQVLTDADIDRWWLETGAQLARITPAVLVSRLWHSALPSGIEPELLVRGGFHVDREYSESDIALSVDGTVFRTLQQSDATVEMMKIIDGSFQLLGYITFPIDATDRVLVTVGNSVHSVTDSGRFNDFEVFGRPLVRNFTFDVRVPVAELDVTASTISVAVSSGESGTTHQRLRLNFRRPQSKLMNTTASYWATAGRLFTPHRRHIAVRSAHPGAVAVREIVLWLACLYSMKARALPIIGLRVAATVSSIGRRWRKPVWLFADKMITAGDNGEYAFSYAHAHADDVRSYYVLDARSRDADRLRAAGIRFVRYGSIKHRVLFLTAETLFLTHTVSTLNNAFPRGVEKFFRGLFNSRVVFIQHGLSVQYLPRILNKAFDASDYYCIASPIERATLEKPAYGYRADELIDTGLARFDGLVDRSGKHILISPTWRNYLVLPTDTTDASSRHRGASTNFASSAFFSVYAALLESVELLAAARAQGFRITFLVHPLISAQRALFDRFANDVVSIVSATDNVRYEDLLTEASVLVTDYSGIQFDMAYMRKPIVYFQPAELPPSYRDDVFTYEQHAFGPIVTNHDDAVSELVRHMSEGTSMPAEFIARVDNFFYYSDRRNSERIIDFARSLTQRSRARQ